MFSSMKSDYHLLTYMWSLFVLQKINIIAAESFSKCFTLKVHTGTGSYMYDDVPESLQLTFMCNNGEYAKVESVRYSIPMNGNDYCPTLSCTGVCSCCDNKLSGNKLCVIFDPSLKVINDRCRNENGNCTYSFKKKLLDKSKCPSSDYKCKPQAICYSRWIDVTYNCITIKDPGRPGNVTAVPLHATSVLVNWTEPDQPNGQIKGYKVYYTMSVQGGQVTTAPGSITVDRTSVVLTQLVPNKQYTVWVSAFTEAGEGPLSEIVTIKQRDDPLPPAPKLPPTPSNTTTPAVPTYSSHEVTTENIHQSNEGFTISKPESPGWLAVVLVMVVIIMVLLIVLAIVITCLFKRRHDKKDNTRPLPLNTVHAEEASLYAQINERENDDPPSPPPRPDPSQTIPKLLIESDDTAIKPFTDDNKSNDYAFWLPNGPNSVHGHDSDKSFNGESKNQQEKIIESTPGCVYVMDPKTEDQASKQTFLDSNIVNKSDILTQPSNNKSEVYKTDQSNTTKPSSSSNNNNKAVTINSPTHSHKEYENASSGEYEPLVVEESNTDDEQEEYEHMM